MNDVQQALETIFSADSALYQQRGFQRRIIQINDRNRFQRRTDDFLRTRYFQRTGDDAAHLPHLAPLFRQRLVAPFRRDGRELLQMHRNGIPVPIRGTSGATSQGRGNAALA